MAVSEKIKSLVGFLTQGFEQRNDVFEDMAAAMLKNDAALRKLLDDKRSQDTAFARNGQAQLDFVYRHSPYMEPGFQRYPVFRVE